MLPASLMLTPAPTEISGVCAVTIQALDSAGNEIAGVFNFDLWLSDATSGEGLTTVTASGTVTNQSGAGLVIDTFTAKKALRVQTIADGSFVLEITDSAKTHFTVCALSPGTGKVIRKTLATGDYA